MLVLSRKDGQSIRIGDEVTIKVLGIHGNRVKIGISSPEHIDIVRGELLFSEMGVSEPAPRPMQRSLVVAK